MKRISLVLLLILGFAFNATAGTTDYAGIIEFVYPGAVALKDYTLRDDGKGIFIDKWSYPATKPTIATLDTKAAAYATYVSTSATALQTQKSNLKIKLNLSDAELKTLLLLLKDVQ